ncbi:hypothetical protein GDO86_002288 [Hymenochirus boettgeri]|uniref:NACHT domain-containing protein n=1 Tax=Hymenochirus boettgeri TaxID=247094 RepID=A0A8T2KGA0_9PIPI|nr:hypothetical protein GDO86_002288 [Hymenochirus boettgeri]
MNSWKNLLIEMYNCQKFHEIPSFGESVGLNVDLDSLFADISIASKDNKNQPVEQFTLPEILSNLRDITMIKGKAGSGKSALLRKIAILWASGQCPMLNRFKLVFYISVSANKIQDTLENIICKQLIGPAVIKSQEILQEMMKHLKNQILFLLDDYGLMETSPEAIEELLLKSHSYSSCLAVTVRTDKGKKLRQYARNILEIQNFPLNSTLYLIKNLFSHEIENVMSFFIKVEKSKSLQTTLNSPLMTLAHCAFWIQNPQGFAFSDKHIFEAYLAYNLQKFSCNTERMLSVIMSCGDLALNGVFHSCFDFTEVDLNKFGVDSEEALKFGLLCKFSAQRLCPVYRFINTLFQEFLAGKRIGELLESDLQEHIDRGLHYLQCINSFLKMEGQYRYFLKYATRNSSKATVKILSQLFSLYDKKNAVDCHLENREHLQRHPELQMKEAALMLQLQHTDSDSFRTYLLLNFAVNAAIQCRGLQECAPVILQFLTGKVMFISLSPVAACCYDRLLYFIQKYPESIALLSCFTCIINSGIFSQAPDFSEVSKSFEKHGVPDVEQEYSSAFLSLPEIVQEKEKQIKEANQTLSLFPQSFTIRDSVIQTFSALQGHKAPIFKLEATKVSAVPQSEAEKLKVLFSSSDHIKLRLNNSSGFVQDIGSAIERHLDCFKECTINNTFLSKEEQQLLLKMSSLESLEIANSKDITFPYFLISGLHRFTCLNELSIKQPNYPDLAGHIPDEFGKPENIRRLTVSCDFAKGSTRFVKFISTLTKLEVLNLHFKCFPDFKGLMTSISLCNYLKELSFYESNLQENDMAHLANTINNFTSLNVLNLGNQTIPSLDVSESLVLGLGSLVNLEKLFLPKGEGMEQKAKLFIGQIHKLPNLQHLSMTGILNDESICELGCAMQKGHLRKLFHLALDLSYQVTESGWREFFQTVNNVPELNLLNINRMYTHQVKFQPTTVKSFVQCVSRLPSLVTILMYGWLLDKDDLNMFNIMKESHPQSNSLTIYYQWFLPFPANIKG